jgi:hypothetical protein
VRVAALLGALAAFAGSEPGDAVRLPVPLLRQAPERCGPAALGMVLSFYGAPQAALGGADRAYDPVLKGALITTLAASARAAGYEAAVETVAEDSLIALLRLGVPPVLLYDRGVGPMTRRHYGVLVGWDPLRRQYALNDGGPSTRWLRRDDLMRRWRAAGGLALVVRRRR